MGVTIPFVREMAFTYGEVTQVSPLVRRIVARNPSLFTLHGTNTYLVGRGPVAVVDPGPLLEEHQAALRRAIGGDTVSHVLVTHRHLDHSQAARALAEQTGAVLAAGLCRVTQAPPAGLEEGVDRDFAPDLVLAADDAVEGPGWRLVAVPTPGHTSDHLCFALPQEGVLFTGDHVMGWSTSVVIPPDGHMRAYVSSLRLLQARADRILRPTHGPEITDPAPYLAALVAHREEREAQILAALSAGEASVPGIVRMVYAAVDRRLHVAAGLSVLAHLRALVGEGRVACEGEPGLGSVYRPGRRAISTPARARPDTRAVKGIEAFWAEFAAATGVAAPYETGAFAETSPALATELALLVRDGPKRATTGVWAEYQAEGEPLPEPGAYWVVLDGQGDPVCIVRTTRVELRRFGDVDERFAWDEGEGDRSLAYWREAHIGYLASVGIAVDDDTLVVLEWFELVWPPADTAVPA